MAVSLAGAAAAVAGEVAEGEEAGVTGSRLTVVVVVLAGGVAAQIGITTSRKPVMLEGKGKDDICGDMLKTL